MCSERYLQILICVTAVISSSNGFPDKDRLSVDDRLRKVEMDYGERLSSYVKGPQRLERLIGKARPVPKLLNQQKTQSTKCTTSQPISVDLSDLKNSDEDSKSRGSITDTAVTIPGGNNPPLVTPPDGHMVNDGDKDGADLNSIGSDENKVQSDKGLNEDPAKDDDDDATLSTKKYFGPKVSYVPDHYLDDARK